VDKEKPMCLKGCIIATSGDVRLENALHAVDDVSFIKFEINFRLVSEF